MNLRVKRQWFTGLSTTGLFLIENNFQCFTLEPPVKTDNTKPRAIPCGTFALVIRFSPTHGRLIPHIEKVPDFTAVEIHIGNYPHDTLGCVLVGGWHGVDFIGQSHGAFDDLYVKLWTAQQQGQKLLITMEDAPLKEAAA